MQSQYEKAFGLLDDAQEKGWTWDGIFEYMKKVRGRPACRDRLYLIAFAVGGDLVCPQRSAESKGRAVRG